MTHEELIKELDELLYFEMQEREILAEIRKELNELKGANQNG